MSTAAIGAYRGMTPDLLDEAYNNVRADPDYARRFETFKARSAALYQRNAGTLNEHYGAGERQRFDWLPSGRPAAPTFVFIHGGYWQTYTKEDVAFVAEGALATGFNVVLAEYTLAPDATLTQIVNEIGMLLDHLRSRTDEIGFGDRPVILCGHSAGGHLAEINAAHPAVDLVVAISAIFDLVPIALSWLNVKLRLNREEIASFSPMHVQIAGPPRVIAVGTVELPELVRQSRDYADLRTSIGQRVRYVPLNGRTHFSVLDDLADPEGSLLSTVRHVMARSLS